MLCSVRMGLTGGSMNEYPYVLLEPREYQLYFLLARTRYIDLKNGFLFSSLGSSTMVFLFFFFSIFHFDYRNCLQCRQKILQSTTQNLQHRLLTAVLIIVVPYNTSCYHTCVTLLLIALRYQL